MFQAVYLTCFYQRTDHFPACPIHAGLRPVVPGSGVIVSQTPARLSAALCYQLLVINERNINLTQRRQAVDSASLPLEER